MSDDVERVIERAMCIFVAQADEAAQQLPAIQFINNRSYLIAGTIGAALTASRSYSDEIEEGVTQEDREAAAKLLRRWRRSEGLMREIEIGEADDLSSVQALRAHRVAALKVQTGERHG